MNAVRTIGAALRSVLAQICPDFEVIVVDDGSRDGTAAAVRAVSDPRVRLLTQENRSPSLARNLGISDARRRLICHSFGG